MEIGLAVPVTTISGTSGADILTATTAGDWTISGLAGNDTITGNSGKDTFIGGAGADVIRGNAGADLFKYAAANETPVGAPDKIVDFQLGVDHIDLSGIDAVSSLAGNQAFHFIGSSAFTKHAGELRVDVSNTTVTKVLGDLNGDGVADFAIHLSGHLALTSGDFIL
jgi:Ca2+-binding RTX toxin-like protein